MHHYLKLKRTAHFACCFSICTFSNDITFLVHRYLKLKRTVHFECCFSIRTFSNDITFLVSLLETQADCSFFECCFSIRTFSNYITLFVHHYCKLKPTVYLNVVFQFSLSLITLPYLSIITVNSTDCLFLVLLFVRTFSYYLICQLLRQTQANCSFDCCFSILTFSNYST